MRSNIRYLDSFFALKPQNVLLFPPLTERKTYLGSLCAHSSPLEPITRLSSSRDLISSLRGNVITQEGHKIRRSAVALEIGAYASASGLSVAAGTPSLEAHSKVEGLDMFW